MMTLTQARRLANSERALAKASIAKLTEADEVLRTAQAIQNFPHIDLDINAITKAYERATTKTRG